MDNLSGKVIIANHQTAPALEALRKNAYHNSQSFKIVDEEALTAYSRWSEKDESGIVLLAIDEAGDALATLRGNVRFSLDELIRENILFTGTPIDFCLFPSLDLTFAATAPHVFKSGLNSVLRYYMYILHRHTVKSILGTCVQHSSIHKTLERLCYDFRAFDKYHTALQKRREDAATLIAQLPIEKIDSAIESLSVPYWEAIKRFPLVIN